MYFCQDSCGVFLALVVAGSLQKSDMWKTLWGLILEYIFFFLSASLFVFVTRLAFFQTGMSFVWLHMYKFTRPINRYYFRTHKDIFRVPLNDEQLSLLISIKSLTLKTTQIIYHASNVYDAAN